MKIFISTLGCKVNQYESQAILETFCRAGYEKATDAKVADVIIINSCTVTAESDKKVRKTLHRLRKENPAAIIALVGCLPQAFPEKMSQLAEADIILGNANKTQVFEKVTVLASSRQKTTDIRPFESDEEFAKSAIERPSQAVPDKLSQLTKADTILGNANKTQVFEKVTELASSRQKTKDIKPFETDESFAQSAIECPSQAVPEKMSQLSDADIILANANKTQALEKITNLDPTRQKITDIRPFKSNERFAQTSISTFEERTRAFVKIEDGCNRFCSYCIIPYARGRVRSRPLDDIAAEVQALARSGYKEVVLVGINLSAYGTDLGLTLCDAVEKVCAIDGIKRVRLGSLEPEYLDENTIKRLARQEKLCPHFHLSLQSGCDATLKRMNRHYTSAEYYGIVKNLRECFENVALTTDVMVGFARETVEEFDQSLNFVRKVGFAKVHVFAYSIRSGTIAATFENQVRPDVKKQRSQVMLAAVEESRRYFLNTQVGRVEPVLFEQQDSDGFWLGHTRNYTPVKMKSEENLQAKVLLVELTEHYDNSVIFGK